MSRKGSCSVSKKIKMQTKGDEVVICSKCGKSIAETDNFCSECGAKLNERMSALLDKEKGQLQLW